MVIYERGKDLQWNLENIRFLYPPDDFVGAFTNKKMQERHRALQEEKINALLNGLAATDDPWTAMFELHKLDHIQFVSNNLNAFKKAGRLEQAVLHLYYRANTPFSADGDQQIWEQWFNNCDPQLLADQGQPLPADELYGYRGSVTGKPRGLSWCVDTKKVAWFLDRWQDKETGGGMIVRTRLRREDILTYLVDDKKNDVIIRPELVAKLQYEEVTDKSQF